MRFNSITLWADAYAENSFQTLQLIPSVKFLYAPAFLSRFLALWPLYKVCAASLFPRTIFLYGLPGASLFSLTIDSSDAGHFVGC
jgi:hypothetical protein